jgi:hypothetical protein
MLGLRSLTKSYQLLQDCCDGGSSLSAGPQVVMKQEEVR